MWELVGKLTAGQSCDPNETLSGDENDAKATAAGAEFFDPQNWGIKVWRRPLLIP